MDRRHERLMLRIVVVLLLCGGGVLLKRAVLPTDRDLGIILALRYGDTRAVAMDPAGTRLAIVDPFGGVRIVGIADGREQRRIPSWEAPRQATEDLALNWGWQDLIVFSPDGRHLAQGGGRGLRLWSLDRLCQEWDDDEG